MQSLPHELTSLLVLHSHRPIQGNILWLMLSNGAADLNDNIIFFGFEDDRNEPSFVAKIPRLSKNRRIIQTEYECLMELWGRMGVDAANYVPEPLAMFQVDKQPVLVISYVSGEGLVYSAKSGLWHNPETVLKLSQVVAHSLRRMHDNVSTLVEDGEFFLSDFDRKVKAFIEIYSPTINEKKALSQLTDHYRLKSAKYKTLIQGDLWHGNIIRNGTGNNLMFIDWQYARWSTDVSLDVYMFLLAGAISISEGSDAERASFTMDILRKWRTTVIPAHLAAYGPVDRFTVLPVRYGMMLCCVEKAARAILDFGYHQSDDLIWRNLFSELANDSVNGLFDDI